MVRMSDSVPLPQFVLHRVMTCLGLTTLIGMSGTLLPCAPRPWTTAHNPHDSAPRGKAPGARTPRSSSNHRTRRARYQPKRRPTEFLNHHKKTHEVPPKRQQPTRSPKDPKLASCPPLYLRGSNASLLHVFGSASLPAPTRSLEKRGVP